MNTISYNSILAITLSVVILSLVAVVFSPTPEPSKLDGPIIDYFPNSNTPL